MTWTSEDSKDEQIKQLLDEVKSLNDKLASRYWEDIRMDNEKLIKGIVRRDETISDLRIEVAQQKRIAAIAILKHAKAEEAIEQFNNDTIHYPGCGCKGMTKP